MGHGEDRSKPDDNLNYNTIGGTSGSLPGALPRSVGLKKSISRHGSQTRGSRQEQSVVEEGGETN